MKWTIWSTDGLTSPHAHLIALLALRLDHGRSLRVVPHGLLLFGCLDSPLARFLVGNAQLATHERLDILAHRDNAPVIQAIVAVCDDKRAAGVLDFRRIHRLQVRNLARIGTREGAAHGHGRRALLLRRGLLRAPHGGMLLVPESPCRNCCDAPALENGGRGARRRLDGDNAN